MEPVNQGTLRTFSNMLLPYYGKKTKRKWTNAKKDNASKIKMKGLK